MMVDSDTRTGECECCGYTTLVTRRSVFYLPTDTTRADVWYCDVCWASGLGAQSRYGVSETTKSLARPIGFIANMILDAIARKDASDE